MSMKNSFYFYTLFLHVIFMKITHCRHLPARLEIFITISCCCCFNCPLSNWTFFRSTIFVSKIENQYIYILLHRPTEYVSVNELIQSLAASWDLFLLPSSSALILETLWMAHYSTFKDNRKREKDGNFFFVVKIMN